MCFALELLCWKEHWGIIGFRWGSIPDESLGQAFAQSANVSMVEPPLCFGLSSNPTFVQISIVQRHKFTLSCWNPRCYLDKFYWVQRRDFASCWLCVAQAPPLYLPCPGWLPLLWAMVVWVVFKCHRLRSTSVLSHVAWCRVWAESNQPVVGAFTRDFLYCKYPLYISSLWYLATQDRCLWMRLLLGCPVLKSFVSVEALESFWKPVNHRTVTELLSYCSLRCFCEAGGMVTLGEAPYAGETSQAA